MYLSTPLHYYYFIPAIDWFEQHVIPSQVILCLEIREPYSLYIYFYFFVSFFSKGFFFFHIIFESIYLTHKWDLNRYYHSRSVWTWEWWQWRCTPLSLELQSWSLTIRYRFCVMGGWTEVKGKLCCHLISDSILRLFYFTPHSLVDVTPWTRRPKKNYTKEDSNRLETKMFLLYFSFISWVQQPFNGWRNFPWIQLKWLNPPVKVFKNTLIISLYMFVLIWYFKASTMVSHFWEFAEVQCFSS